MGQMIEVIREIRVNGSPVPVGSVFDADTVPWRNTTDPDHFCNMTGARMRKTDAQSVGQNQIIELNVAVTIGGG